MRVDELSIQNFRNLADPVFRADPRINIIFGNNAQGKTNLMEALWLFTGNRSFRGARDIMPLSFPPPIFPLSRMALKSGGGFWTSQLHRSNRFTRNT